MRKNARILALLLAFMMLLAALPAYAADDTAVAKQASAKCKLLSAPRSNADTLATISKNDAVLALGVSGSYTLAQAGGKQGYIETKRLKSVTSSANVKGIALAASPVTLYDAAGGNAAAKAGAMSVFAVLCEGTDWLALRQGGAYYYAKRADVAVYNPASPATQFALMGASASVLDGAGKSAKKLATAAKGELVAILYKLTGTMAIVKKGVGTIGVTSIAKADLYAADGAVGAVTTTASATLYRGAGTKLEKLGTVKKGATLHKLGHSGAFTVVLVNGEAACIATKSVRQDGGGDLAAPPSSTGAINTDYVEFTQRTQVFAAASVSSESYGFMPAGSVVRYYGTTADGNWIQVQVDSAGNKGFAERRYASPTQLTQSEASQTGGDIELEFIACMNAYRKTAGAKALSVSAALMRAAAIRAEEITRRFSHTRPDGTACNTVDPANIFGENIAMGITLPTAQAAAMAFMGSSEHKENALRSSFTKTGAARLKVGDVYYWVHLFG